MRVNILVGSALRSSLVVLTAFQVAGCATLPTNGPTGPEIKRDAEGSDNVMGYRIVDIDAQSIRNLTMADDRTLALAALGADGPVDTLGPGDILSIDVYEVGAGLFSGNHTSLGGDVASMDPAPAPAASGSPLGGVTVDRDGAISVPYVGRIMVAGLTPSQVQDKILQGLRGKSQSPQVIVALARNVANTVVVMGAVAKPGRLPLTLAKEHLLDGIADAGGIISIGSTGGSTATGTGPQDMIVRFTRDGRTIEQPLDSIRSGSPDDLLLLPGDRVEVIRQPRTFTVFGALDRISQMPFESQRLSLAEALARAGGPSDARADPRSIFVFRLTPPVVNAAGKPIAGPEGAASGAVIYRLNLMKASGYILAQQFAMRDKDLIYISNATSNQPTKLVQILNLLFTPIFSIKTVAN